MNNIKFKKSLNESSKILLNQLKIALLIPTLKLYLIQTNIYKNVLI